MSNISESDPLSVFFKIHSKFEEDGCFIVKFKQESTLISLKLKCKALFLDQNEDITLNRVYSFMIKEVFVRKLYQFSQNTSPLRIGLLQNNDLILIIEYESLGKFNEPKSILNSQFFSSCKNICVSIFPNYQNN